MTWVSLKTASCLHPAATAKKITWPYTIQMSADLLAYTHTHADNKFTMRHSKGYCPSPPGKSSSPQNPERLKGQWTTRLENERVVRSAMFSLFHVISSTTKSQGLFLFPLSLSTKPNQIMIWTKENLSLSLTFIKFFTDVFSSSAAGTSLVWILSIGVCKWLHVCTCMNVYVCVFLLYVDIQYPVALAGVCILSVVKGVPDPGAVKL